MGGQRCCLIPSALQGPRGMLPIRENVLQLAEIAEYWSRELQGIRTSTEIYAELLSGFWQNQLAAVNAHNLHPIQRLNVLKGINATRFDP